MTTRLDALKRHSLVVADTGDLDAIERYRPHDATTNPSLLLKAFDLPGYQALIDEELAAGERPAPLDEPAFRWGHNLDAMATDKLAEGIRRFDTDQRTLEARIAERLG